MLEPELLCRLVYVKDVECQTTESSSSSSSAAAVAVGVGGLEGGGGAFRAPPGTTELPTCPVCLERLDEHISGIVTTVGGAGGGAG